ncbi:glucose-1-phosphate thymidylyltransferase [Candidatus Wirthbacteria bacterium CG2_30_54_11]|uniref:Glucose-1-phosphate thymidylyltransferase n=1 Tax=Candidatus Wirthbacteria bacterium CG2_30_54_11 TaxID=1817892 RepID=A0A1J5ITY3_9BACT|nr:MAG: glucose-1-phosphate thymidylyltransferase [Candidatus Wirthbacteria bacterium CG2_30_54_11]
MKAVITAGGRGTRLRPLTHTLNKHLVPICNKPLLFHALEKVAAIGVQNVIISMNQGDEELPKIVGDGSAFGVSISYVEQDEPRGLAHVLRLAEPLIGNERFVFYYGDNVLAGGLELYAQQFVRNRSNCHLCLVKVAEPQHYGVAVVDGDRVITAVEKPQTFISDLAITGIQFYDESIFEAIKYVRPTPPKPPRMIPEMDIPPANQWLIDQGYKVTYSEITGWWKDTGKPKDLLEASRLVLEHLVSSQKSTIDSTSSISDKCIVGKNTRIIESRIVGPVIIGDNCTIRGATIGPNVSIANRCKITQSTISNSIILDDSEISLPSRPLQDSIIGQHVVLGEQHHEGRASKLLVGDHSAMVLNSV